MDTHLSMVSNRLNVIMKQLAIVATFFLPLSFLTGFFGQNFAWSINHLQTNLPWFLGLGVGTELVAIAVLLYMFRRRGWMGSGPTA
jgi:magnesium transporter